MSIRRVAYVVNVFPKLSETFIAHELAELRRRGIEVRVLSLRQPTESRPHQFIAATGLGAVACYDPAAFARILDDFEPQVIHAHFATEPAAAARVQAAARNVPFTFTAHGYDIHRKPPPDFAERATAARAVITVSHANARYITDTFGVSARQLRIIPCGVDTASFRPPEAHADEAAPPLLVNVARHAPVKNLPLLLDTCAALQRRNVRFTCVQVGDGPRRAELEAYRDSLSLHGVVRFVGAADQEQVLDWWRQATVAVLTSESEGMPVCLMEAAACGVPAVATAVGGVPELILHGVTGLLAPPGDPEALAKALESLLDDPALRRKMGTAARRRAETRFSLARQVDALLAVWNEAVA